MFFNMPFIEKYQKEYYNINIRILLSLFATSIDTIHLDGPNTKKSWCDKKSSTKFDKWNWRFIKAPWVPNEFGMSWRSYWLLTSLKKWILFLTLFSIITIVYNTRNYSSHSYPKYVISELVISVLPVVSLSWYWSDIYKNHYRYILLVIIPVGKVIF